MKKRYLPWLLILLPLIFVVGACTPKTYTAPMQIHINPGDHVEQAAIAMDSHGISYITGVVNDRIIYYRTRYGPPMMTLTMTMAESGTDWKQYDPDIAVTDAGHAYLVWVEQRGSADKFACWREVPFATDHPYYTTCRHLDGNNITTGLVRVVGRGSDVYAVYSRLDPVDNHITILYDRLTGFDGGVVVDYSDNGEKGHIYNLDLGIDSSGKLHIVCVDNDGLDFLNPPRLWYRSNAHTDSSDNMIQVWDLRGGTTLIKDILPSISFYRNYGVERVVFATVWRPFGGSTPDYIFLDQCTASDCAQKIDEEYVRLGGGWTTHSVIDDVNLSGVDTRLFLSFIGDNDTSGPEHIFYKADPYDDDAPFKMSSSLTIKYDLEMLILERREGSIFTVPFPVMVWAESNLASIQYIVKDPLDRMTIVQDTTCLTSVPAGEIATNGIYFAGVWESCKNTWFSTQAHLNNLPLILK